MTARESVCEQLARIPEDLAETDARLNNWARWSRDRIKQGHCRSIEYRYKTTEIWQEAEPKAEWDSLDAVDVHRVVCQLPERYRWMLHMHYIHKAPEGYIRRKLVIHRTAIVEEMQRAVRMVKNVGRYD